MISSNYINPFIINNGTIYENINILVHTYFIFFHFFFFTYMYILHIWIDVLFIYIYIFFFRPSNSNNYSIKRNTIIKDFFLLVKVKLNIINIQLYCINNECFKNNLLKINK